MSSPLGTVHKQTIPSIVVTPALPSRDSLPLEMRSTLDSILRSASVQTIPRDTHTYTNAVVRTNHSHADTEDDTTTADEDSDVPHAPSNTQPATTADHFLLKLDFESTRISFGDVLSSLDVSRRDRAVNTSPRDGDLPADVPSSPISRCSSEFVVVTEEMARGLAPEDASRDAGAGAEPNPEPSDTQVLRRAESHVGACPPTWRHAMYVSTRVWPVQRSRAIEQAPPQEKPLPPIAKSKVRWCSLGMLTRTFGLRR